MAAAVVSARLVVPAGKDPEERADPRVAGASLLAPDARAMLRGAESRGPADLGDIVLEEALVLAGRVLEAGGAPSARVEVRLALAPDPRSWFGGPDRDGDAPRDRTTLTDDLGRYRFGDLAPGQYLLSVPGVSDHRVAVVATDRLQEDIRREAQRVLRVGLDPPDFQGTVWVTARHSSGWTATQVSVFEDLGLPFDATGVTLIASLGVPGDSGAAEAEIARVAVPNDATQARLDVSTVRRIRGSVQDEADVDDWKQGALVRAWRAGRVIATASAGDGGLFELDILGAEPFDIEADGTVYEPVEAGHPDGVARPWHAELRAVMATPERIVLAPRPVTRDRSLRVLMLDPSGAPAPGVGVAWAPVIEDAPSEATTGPDGRVDLAGLGPTRLRLTTAVPASRADAWYAARAEDLVLPAGQEIVLRLRSPRIVAGVLRDATGRPPRDAHVRTLVDGKPLFAQMFPDGRFRYLLDPDAPAHLTFLVLACDERGKPWLHRLPSVDTSASTIVLTLTEANLW